jgi:hypothetical protein
MIEFAKNEQSHFPKKRDVCKLLRNWLLGLDSVPLAVSEANRGATGGQPESHE